VEGVGGLGVEVMFWIAPSIEIKTTQQLPQRLGLFGLLSVGFIAVALLTVLGFLRYIFFSFRPRFIELGILQAIGLSAGQIMAGLAWELVFLILVGVLAGALLGVWASQLFIPFLLVKDMAIVGIPARIPKTAWAAIVRIYVLFISLFLTALGGLTIRLLHIEIFKVTILGEML
jgi:putative ABC transport system permease protein